MAKLGLESVDLDEDTVDLDTTGDKGNCRVKALETFPCFGKLVSAHWNKITCLRPFPRSKKVLEMFNDL
jgi:hypothetical protein